MSAADFSGRGLCNRYPHEFQAWVDMRNRCFKTTDGRYRDYGGRGIIVCERWRSSFRNFLTDMGPKPGQGYSLDRIDNDGPYSPTNCRWATRKSQQRNTRRNHIVTFRGESLCIMDWADRLGIPASVIGTRLKRGWTVEESLTRPSGEIPGRDKMLTFRGKTQNLKAWTAELGIRYNLVHERMRAGWTLERALFTPSRPYGTGR